MKSYSITIKATQFSMSPFLTPLDSTISGLWAREQSSFDYSKPLELTDIFQYHEVNGHRIPMASMPVFEYDENAVPQVQQTIRNLRLHNRHLSKFFNKQNKLFRETHGSKASAYTRGDVRKLIFPKKGLVTYFFTGDLDGVLYYLNGANAIGARTAHGHGTCEIISHTEIVSDKPIGIVRPDGALIRPIPSNCSIAYDESLEPVTPMFGRYSAPYAPHLVKNMGLGLDEITMPEFGITAS